MEDIEHKLILLAGFAIIAVASNRISKLFQMIKLPLITGLLLVGIFAGPHILKLIPEESAVKLNFVNDFALAFIAFAAGAELYVKELRSRFKSITWMTFGQLVVTFLLTGFSVFFLADHIDFMKGMSRDSILAVSLLVGTIFVARSPASAIAVVNELRAKGPFTQTAMGVTVVKDVLVIILFAVCFTAGKAPIKGADFNIGFIGFILVELVASFVLGLLLGRLLGMVMYFRINQVLKKGLILFAGYSIYLFSGFVKDWTAGALGHELYLEPLLICIIGSFVVSNYSSSRSEYLKIIEEVGPGIYVVFFTLAGASMSLNILLDVWDIALILFGIRIVSMVIGSLVGGSLGGDPWHFNRIGWMPYVTQAGVALGLTTIVATEFPAWGGQFATVIIAVIVLNQIVGPPLFKWSLYQVGEDHTRGESSDVIDDNALIFGLEGKSIALAKQLKSHGWSVKIVTLGQEEETINNGGIETHIIKDLELESLQKINAINNEAIITMLTDEENYKVCEIAFEHFGTKDIVVRLNDRNNFEKFDELGALIVEPSSAIVSLLDHMVRSPHATSLLLGMDEGQDSVEVEVANPDLHGMALRDLRLPADVIVVSLFREDQVVISHGYTRLRLGDQITLVGEVNSLENVALRFEAPV